MENSRDRRVKVVGILGLGGGSMQKKKSRVVMVKSTDKPGGQL